MVTEGIYVLREREKKKTKLRFKIFFNYDLHFNQIF